MDNLLLFVGGEEWRLINQSGMMGPHSLSISPLSIAVMLCNPPTSDKKGTLILNAQRTLTRTLSYSPERHRSHYVSCFIYDLLCPAARDAHTSERYANGGVSAGWEEVGKKR